MNSKADHYVMAYNVKCDRIILASNKHSLLERRGGMHYNIECISH